MKIVNLTAHTINEVTSGKEFPPSGKIARVKASTTTVGYVNDIPIYQSIFGEVEGLPPKQKNTFYIVSALVLNALSDDRTDVVAPGNLQRNEHGQPVGCCGFRIK